MFTPKKPPMENGKMSLKDEIEEKRKKFTEIFKEMQRVLLEK